MVLIKKQDDIQPTIDALRSLLMRPGLDARTRRRIEDEIRTTSAGRSGEEDAAYQIDFWMRSENIAVIHDLRIEHRERVAQIDHLLINRFMEVLVCESKSFKEGVAINKEGEWTRYRNGRPQGMASPIAQNEQHIAVLNDLFEDGMVPLPKRLGIPIRPEFKNVVLVSNGARISRPQIRAGQQIRGLDSVLKVEQLREHYERSIDERHAGQVIGAIAMRLIGADTLARVAKDLAALHSPNPFDWSARFGLAAASVKGDQ